MRTAAALRRTHRHECGRFLAPTRSSILVFTPLVSELLVILPQTLSELTGPAFGDGAVEVGDDDLTAGHAGEPLGERILVSGLLTDDAGRAITPIRSPQSPSGRAGSSKDAFGYLTAVAPSAFAAASPASDDPETKTPGVSPGPSGGVIFNLSTL